MKSLLKVQSLLIGLVVLAVGLVALKYFVGGRPIPFKDLPGNYQCEDFGLPDPTFSVLEITPEFRVVGKSPEKQFDVGRLAPRDVGAELEYSMAVVHFSSFNLDPFTAPRLVGYAKSLSIKAKRPDQEFTATCRRIN